MSWRRHPLRGTKKAPTVLNPPPKPELKGCVGGGRVQAEGYTLDSANANTQNPLVSKTNGQNGLRRSVTYCPC